METETVRLSEFLKELNAYEKFIKNFDRDFEDMLWSEYDRNAISSAFDWLDSEQGYHYWKYLDALWEENPNPDNDMKWLIENPEKDPEPDDMLELMNRLTKQAFESKTHCKVSMNRDTDSVIVEVLFFRASTKENFSVPFYNWQSGDSMRDNFQRCVELMQDPTLFDITERKVKERGYR